MSTTVSETITCPRCNTTRQALLVESANVQRHPSYRDQIRSGRFMAFDCLGCAVPIVVEQHLLYTDLPNALMIAVFPRAQRDQALALEKTIEAVFDKVFLDEAPPIVKRSASNIRQRIVFGYEALREKVICFDAGLDDRILEGLKLLLLGPGGDLSNEGVWALRLRAVDESGLLRFGRVSGTDPDEVSGPLFEFPRASYDALVSQSNAIERLLPRLGTGAWVEADRWAEQAL